MRLIKDIGIIGGAGPEAGLLLAKLIISICQKDYQCKRDADFPFLHLVSFPFSEMLSKERKNDVSNQLENLINQELQFTRFWVIACHTLHSYLPDPLPPGCVHLIQSVDTQNNEPVIFCSSTSRNYQIHRKAIKGTYPSIPVQMELDDLIDELVAHPPTFAIYQRFKQLVAAYGNQKILLGCTEFSLLNAYYPLGEHCIDPLIQVAKKLCFLHFESKKCLLTV